MQIVHKATPTRIEKKLFQVFLIELKYLCAGLSHISLPLFHSRHVGHVYLKQEWATRSGPLTRLPGVLIVERNLHMLLGIII